MKKRLIISIAAALALFAGCQKAEFAGKTQPAGGQTIRVSVSDFGQVSSNGPTTKLAADDITAATVKFKWELNDTLALVSTSTMDVYKFVCTDATEGTFTKFTEEDLPTDCNYAAVYPASRYALALAAGTMVETYRGNQIPIEHLVLGAGPENRGYSHDATAITLDRHASIIHILLKGDAKVGKITYSKAGSETESTILSCGDGVQLSSTPTDFYIDAIAVSSQGFTVSIYDTEGNKLATKSSTMNLTTYRYNKIVDFTTPIEVNAAPAGPAGALSGEFSVSGTKKVRFSKGNLWADGSNALHFESNQYSSASSWDASHVSHFTWSSTVEAAVGESNSGDNLFCDESHKVSVDGGDAIYYALSKDEWTYLFNNHTKKWASVNEVDGYVIAPDGFTGNLESSYANDAALASAGNLVFLPAAGGRNGYGVSDVGGLGLYWSSTAGGSSGAYCVYFYSSSVRPDIDGDGRGSGYSVRLITECQ